MAGAAADGIELAGGLLVLDTAPGDHEHELAAVTDYGLLPGKTLRYRAEP